VSIFRKHIKIAVLFVAAFFIVSIVFAVEVTGSETISSNSETLKVAKNETTVEADKIEDSYISYDVNAIVAAEVSKVIAYVEEVKRQEQAAADAAANPPTRLVEQSNYDPGDGSRWDQLAKCECGGNWGCNTGNGFGGGLQFMHQSSYSTWLSYGGGEFTPNPWEASREQQIVVAERVLAGSGWKAWPGCSRKFGWL